MDTPGFREFALTGISPPDLGRYYPEFQEAIAGCRFRDCLHRGEPGCELVRRVEEGAISKLRYQNYLQILRTLVEKGPENPSRRSAGRGSTPPSERMRPKS
jgi:ribosome biogenesis GTPase